MEPFEPPGWLQLRAMFPYTEILFPPGSTYSYSNPGLVFIGQVIERVTHEDYETYVEKNVLRPLEMSRRIPTGAPTSCCGTAPRATSCATGAEPAPFDLDRA